MPRNGSCVAWLAVAMLLAALLVIGSACTNNEASSSTSAPPASSSTSAPPASSSTSAPPTSSSTAVSSTSSTSTTFPSLLSDWDRELARTAKIQRDVAAFIAERGNKKDDPLLGLYYGLQARTRALTARKALAESNLDLADIAMLDVYRSLNLARNVATGETADTVAKARTIVETLGAPSDKPQQAAASLEEFIAALSPLLDQASAVLSSTSTT